MVRSLLLTLALLALPAFAAGQLDAARAQVTQARTSLNAVRAEQTARTTELRQHAARIEALKSVSSGKLLPGGELDAELKASQELSDKLTNLTQVLSAKESELENANLALLTELSAELSRLRAEFDRQTDRNARLATITRLRQARGERDQVRAALPAARVPAALVLKPSDNPEDLLEQADAALDQQEKVLKQLKAVEKRIAERKDERDLDRRVNQFLGEDSFFDDSDRRLRVRREITTPITDSKTTGGTTTLGASADPGGAQNKTPITRDQVGLNLPPPPSSSDFTAMGAASPSANNTRTETQPAPQQPAPPADAAPAGESQPTSVTTVKQGSDGRPVIGPIKRVAGGEDEDLEDLEVQRAKLKGLSEELKAKARQLQKKASELR
jgi:hypothetical protein